MIQKNPFTVSPITDSKFPDYTKSSFESNNNTDTFPESIVQSDLPLITPTKIIKNVLNIKHDLIIPKDEIWKVEPGTKINLYPDTNLIIVGRLIAIGTKDEPIVFTSAYKDKPWGSIVIHNNPKLSIFEYCNISNGHGSVYNRLPFTGVLNPYNSSVICRNTTFSNNKADDVINAKYSFSKIENCFFTNNEGDAIDYDFSAGIVQNSYFKNTSGDSIDFSGSTTLITGNTIIKSADKGISVGEKSRLSITNNTIIGNNIGIAVKDVSIAKIYSNTFKSNITDISLYEKKENYGGGKAILKSNIFSSGSLKIIKDAKSEIVESK